MSNRSTFEPEVLELPTAMCGPASGTVQRGSDQGYLSTLCDMVDVGIVIVDLPQCSVLRVNPRARAMLLDARVEAQFATLRTLFFPQLPNSNEIPVTRSISCGATILGFTAYRVNERVLAILFQDVTERKRLETIAEAANLMDNIGAVFAGIRHELGNPVNSLKVTLSVLRKNLSVFAPDTVVEYIDRAVGEVARVEYLLSNLRSFSMFESITLQTVDLPRFFEQFTALVDEDLAARGVSLSIDIAAEASLVKADDRALQQVLLNLVTNALDAMEGCDSPKIEVSSSVVGAYVELVVADNGHGIGAQELDSVFRPFFTTKPKGTGLGLVIAKKMLAAMSGGIKIRSQVELGTSVSIVLQSGQPRWLSEGPTVPFRQQEIDHETPITSR